MTALVTGSDLCLFRGDRCLFKSLEFALNSGELLVIEGTNGSGKTSLLRGIAGLLEFENGEIRWGDTPAIDDRQRFLSNIVWLAHKVGFKGDLNLMENLRFEDALRATRPDQLGNVLARLNLTTLVDLPLRSLSAGQQRRVALARMLLAEACVWIMDEPFTNLDKAGHALVDELLSEHLAQNGAAIVATHQAVEISGKIKRVSLS